eukprot:4550781-Prymnesium_polylepis.1
MRRNVRRPLFPFPLWHPFPLCACLSVLAFEDSLPSLFSPCCSQAGPPEAVVAWDALLKKAEAAYDTRSESVTLRANVRRLSKLASQLRLPWGGCARRLSTR